MARARNDDALGMLRRADAIFSEHAAGTVEYSANLSNLGAVHLKEGRLDAADSCFTRALALREALLEPDHPELATACNN
ncbi:MAG: tetratricopeptide repeat protein, partial [bacterium]|nr:tetratricopeptide repeat protein [bacterium]